MSQPYDMEATAYHEAGHVTMMVKWGIPIDWVAIHPLPDHFGGKIGELVFSEAEPGATLASREADLEELKRTWFARKQMLQAGHMAESIFLGKWVPMSGTDFLAIEELGKASGQDLSLATTVDCDYPTRQIIEELWPQITAVALALIERRMLSGDEVSEIIRAVERIFPSAPQAHSPAPMAPPPLCPE